MSLSTVQTLLETHLEDIWVNRTRIKFDNVHFRPKNGTPFLRTTLDQIDSDDLSFSCTRDLYIFTIQILVPVGAGSDLINQYSDLIVNNFKKYAVGNLKCKNAVSKRVGDEKEWFQRNVDVAVQYDQHD